MITAILQNWSYNKKMNVIVGDIYEDKASRWPDGTFIQTSTLRPMSMQESSPREGATIFTENSSYMLGKKK